MDTFECIFTKLDIREFSKKNVPTEIKEKILEAARQTGTGLNTQHWRFILVEDKDNLHTLSEDSTSGRWVDGANFAIIILTNPEYGFHMIDSGRVLQNMQLTAWNYGVGSGIFTGINKEKFEKDFTIPKNMNITVTIGFGYPTHKLSCRKKNRLPLHDLVYYEKYGRSSKI